MGINDFRRWLEEDDEDEKGKSTSNSLSTEQSTESQESGTFESFNAWLNTPEEDTSYQEKMEESVKPTEEAVKPEEEKVGLFKKVGNFVKDITLGKRKEGDKRTDWERFQEEFVGFESKGGKANREEVQQYYDNLKTGKEKIDTLQEVQDLAKLRAYEVLKEKVDTLSEELGTNPQIIGKDYERVKGTQEYIALKKLEAELGMTYISKGILPEFLRNIDIGFAKGNAFNEEGTTIATPTFNTSTLKKGAEATKKLEKEGWDNLSESEQSYALIDFVNKLDQQKEVDKSFMDKIFNLQGTSLGWGSAMATSGVLSGGGVPDPTSVSTGLLKTLEVAGVQAVRAMNLAPLYTSEIDRKYLDLTTPEYAYFVDKTGDIIIEKLQDARYSEEEEGFGVISKDNKAKQMAQLSNYLEVYSESWGNVLGTGGEEFMNSLIKTKVFGSFANWMRKTGKLAQGILSYLLKQAKFDGVIGEFMEEELLNPLQSVIERTEYQGVDTKEGRERMLIEFLGFGATQSGAMIQGYVQNKDKGKAIDFINNNKEKFGLAEDKALDKEGNLYDVDSGEIIVPKEEVMKEPESVFGGVEIDKEEEMLKADIAQAEEELKAEPVQEVKIQEDEVKTDYSEDAKVQEVLRDISVVLDQEARKKVVSKVEGSESANYGTEDYTYGVEGVIIPEFIPEELRSRKYVQKAYDAFLNNTVPQEGTKAWQVYQAILEESKGREGLEMSELEITESKADIEIEPPYKADNFSTVLKELEENKEGEYDFKTLDEMERWVLKHRSGVSNSKKERELIKRAYEWLDEGVIKVENTKGTRPDYVTSTKEEKVEGEKPAHIRKGIELAKDIRSQEAKNMAREVVKPYLKEGAEQFIKTQYVQTLPDFVGSFQAGGYINGKKIKRGNAVIELADGRVFEYKVQDLFDEAKDEQLGIDIDDLPFRQRELKVLEDKFLDKLTIERMKSFSKEWFGDEDVEMVKNILRNKKALGMYLNRLIEIRSGQAHVGSTFYHEAIHKAFDIFLTPEEKKIIINEVIKRVGKKELLEMYNNKSEGDQAKFREMYFKHGTKYDIVNGFNLDNVGKGEGNPKDAHALYLTEDIFYARDFAYSQFGRNDAKVYDVKVDIDPAMMLRFGAETERVFAQDERFAEDRKNPYWKEWTQRMKILDGLMDKWKKDNNIDYRKESNKELRVKQEQKYRRQITDTTASMEELYNQLSLELGSKKNASEFLVSLGFDGVLQTTKGGLTIGLFDTGKIKDYEKIYNIQQAMYRGGNDSITLEASANEWLAENVIDYINNRNSTTFWGKLKRMVDIFVDRMFRGIDHIKDIEDFYESLISGRLLDRQQKLEAKQQKNWNKYLASIQGTGTKTDAVYRTEVAKEIKKLTTKILKRLKGKTTVKKQFISDLTKQQDIKQVEKDIINDVLKKFPDQIDVATFEEKVLKELLPLDRVKLYNPRYQGIALKDGMRGSYQDYYEVIYRSPIKVDAGKVHFGFSEDQDMLEKEDEISDKYFGHVRIEEINKDLRRVIEVQSDLYQKGRLELEGNISYTAVTSIEWMRKSGLMSKKELADYEEAKKLQTESRFNKNLTPSDYLPTILQIENLFKKREKENREREVSKLYQYNDPTAHMRMVREEISKAGRDNIKTLLFPTGQTGMMIEGLGGEENRWYYEDENRMQWQLFPDKLEIGKQIKNNEGEVWIVKDILREGEFTAYSARSAEMELENDEKMSDYIQEKGYLKVTSDDIFTWNYNKLFADKEILSFLKERAYSESFDISGRTKRDNPIYKFYEDTLGKYLKNNYKAELFKDKRDVTWWKVDIKPEYAESVEAFRLDGLVDYGKVANGIHPQNYPNIFLRIASKFDNAQDFIDHFRGSSTQYGMYTPQLRKFGVSETSARISDLGVDPELKITVYRGIDDSEGNIKNPNIKDGDFVTTDYDSANSYSGTNVISKEVKAKDLIIEFEGDFDINDPFFVGAEFIYSKSSNKLVKYTDEQLKEMFNIAKEMKNVRSVEEWEKEKKYILKNGTMPDSADVEGFKGSKYYGIYGTSESEQKSAYYDYISEKIEKLNGKAMYRIEKEISVKLPELITMATELGANIKLQKSFRKGGKLGDFTAGGDTDSRIRILRTLFEPQGEEVMDGEGNVEKLPETPEQQMDRIHGIEKVLAHEIGHLFDWFGGENNMTLKRGNILGRIANLRNYTEGQFMDLENKEVRKELKTLTQVWNPFDEATAPKKYKSYRYSAKELYAEALSVFLNKPSLVKEVAPSFYQGLVEYMARKEEVQKEYFAIRDMIKEGGEVQSRVENMKKAQEIARGKRMTIDEEKEAYKKQSKWQEAITGIKMGFVNQYAPYLDKMRKAWKDKKISLSEVEQAEQLMGDLALKGNDAVKYAQDVQNEFFVPVSEAGIDIDTVGQILVLERNLGDRIDLANPHGLVYDYAKETYDYVKGQLSPAQWNLLQEKLNWWRDYNFELVKKGYESGVYSEKFFNEIATVNKNTYTPFAVVDYIEDNYVTAGIIQATGTTKGVENPLTTQMLKSLSLMKLTATNGAKQDVVKSLSEIFPDEVVKAESIKDADGRTIGFKKNPKLERAGYKQLELLEDGKKTAYYMDKYIEAMFESSLNGVGWEIARFVTAPLRMVNRIFKPAVTVMKASFQFYSNPLKDYQRSLTNLTALSGLFDKSNVASRTAKVFGAFTKMWIKNLKRSWNYAGGEMDVITQKMLDMYVLSSNVKYEDIDIGNEKFKFDPVKNRIVYKGGVNWLESLRNFGSTIPIIKKTLVPVYDFYMRAGSTFEVNSKIAGFQYLSQQVGEEKAAFYTRRYVGTPDYMQKGKFTPLTNELIVFSNVGVQAITADMDLATRPNTASGYWVSTMFKIVFPKLLMLLGASILRVPIPDPDDPEKKKWVNPYDYLSEYYKSMYMAFPIGYDEESESFMFVKAPSDEVGAVIGNLVWKMATYLQGEGMKIEQLGSAIAGLIPFTTGDNPLLSIGRDWMQYAQGRNPYDDFRGRLAINTSKWNEGGMTRFTEMLKWTSNEMGLTSFSTYDKSSDTTLEKIMELPVLERMFELTNYGLQEREENDKALGKREKNKTLDGYIESYFAEPSNEKLLELQEKYVIAVKGERPEDGWSGTEKAEETRLKSEFKREILANSGNAVYKSIAKAGLDNDEKLEIINKQKKKMSDSEFKDFMAQVVRYEVVKGEMFATYAKDNNLSQDLIYKVVKESIPVLSEDSNNTLIWELRKVDAMSDDTLYKLAKNDNLLTPAGYTKYKSLDSVSYEKRYGSDNKDSNKTKLFK